MPLICETCASQITMLYRIDKNNNLNFCSNECLEQYASYLQECDEEKLRKESKMNLEETHLYYMLLHDMVEVRISESGVAKIEYFPHNDKNIRVAYNVPQTVEEEII